MRRLISVGLALALALALAVALAAVWLRRNSAESSGMPATLRRAPPSRATAVSPDAPPPAPGPVDRLGPIMLLGMVRSAAQETLSVRLPARITVVTVREGDVVTRGELLVQLDDAAALAQRQNAAGAVAAARAQLRRAVAGRAAQSVKLDADVMAAKDGLSQARDKVRQAILERAAAAADLAAQRTEAAFGVKKSETAVSRAHAAFGSLMGLAEVGGVSRSDIEAARAQATVADADLETARAQARRLEAGPPAGPPYRVALADEGVASAKSGVRTAEAAIRTAETARLHTLNASDQEIAAAAAALSQSGAGMTSANAAAGENRLISSISGIAASVTARQGETAQPGSPLVTVVSLSGLTVEALVPARQLARIRPGMPATVSVDTRPGGWLMAKVSALAAVAEPDGRTFRVKFALRNPGSLRLGQTAHVTVPQR